MEPHLTDEILEEILSVESTHSGCNELVHETLTQRICILLAKDLMFNVVVCTADCNNALPMVK